MNILYIYSCALDVLQRLQSYYFIVFLTGCDDCGKAVKVYCKKHGELAKVKDRLIPSRAKLTTPHQVTVKTIELRAGGDHGKNLLLANIYMHFQQASCMQSNIIHTWSHLLNSIACCLMYKQIIYMYYYFCISFTVAPLNFM